MIGVRTAYYNIDDKPRRECMIGIEYTVAPNVLNLLSTVGRVLKVLF